MLNVIKFKIMMPLFKHFSLLEFFPHCSYAEIVEALSSRSVSCNLANLCWLLDSLRSCIGVPVRINSAYRSRARNAKVGGVPTSQHLFGSAADVRKSRKLCELFISHRDNIHDLPDFLHRLGIYQLIEYDTFYHIGIYDEKHDPEYYPSVYIDNTTKTFDPED